MRVVSSCALRPSRAKPLEPFPRHGLERILLPPLSHGHSLPGGLALSAGVYALRQQLARFIAAVPRFPQANLGVGAKAEQLALACEAVGEPPPLPPLGATNKNRPRPSVSLRGFGSCLPLRTATSDSLRLDAAGPC